jgi:hypothetical protein
MSIKWLFLAFLLSNCGMSQFPYVMIEHAPFMLQLLDSVRSGMDEVLDLLVPIRDSVSELKVLKDCNACSDIMCDTVQIAV